MDEKTEAQKGEGTGARLSGQVCLTPKPCSLHYHPVPSGAGSISNLSIHKMERTHVGPQGDTKEDVYHSSLGSTEELGTTWVSHHRALAGCSPEVLCQE